MNDIKNYSCYFYDPKEDNHGHFAVKAFSVGRAEVQTRDGYFGLLAPPTPERAAELEITVVEHE